MGEGLAARYVVVAREDVAWLRYVLEAHDGLALMHSDGSGVVALLTPHPQLAALESLIADLLAEGCISAVLSGCPSSF